MYFLSIGCIFVIHIKNKIAIEKMKAAGIALAHIFDKLSSFIEVGMSTAQVDGWIAAELKKNNMISQSKGYHGYAHVSCISINDEIVHGVPRNDKVIAERDLVKVDVCAALNGFCADMARPYVMGIPVESVVALKKASQDALQAGIDKAVAGNRLYDISAAVQAVADSYGFGIIRDFAGHGIGRRMHESPDVPNYGQAGTGPVLREGMAFAIEPMFAVGSYKVKIDKDGWTARTLDSSLAMHIEDTVIVLNSGPYVTTRLM